MKLRDYQQECVDVTTAALPTDKSDLVVMATGTGKTVVAGHIIKGYVDAGQRVMVMAHREELIDQAAATLHRITGHQPAIEMGDRHADEHPLYGKSPIIVSSVQTQVAGRKAKRRDRFDPKEFGLLWVDEAHHAAANTYTSTIDYYMGAGKCHLLGVTATPNRHDERALGRIFNGCPFNYDLITAIGAGWLVRVRRRPVHVKGLDFSNCRVRAGDLTGADLEAAMQSEEVIHRIVAPTVEIVGSRQTIVFVPTVAIADRMAEIINRYPSGRAEFVCGKTPKTDRREIMARFRSGETQYLCNVGIATEGVDIPECEVVCMARPTLSHALNSQMLGRGTRPLPGLVDGIDTAEARCRAIAESRKPSMLVIDYVGNSCRHDLVTSLDVLGGNYEDVVAGKAKADPKATEVDVLDALSEAAKELLMQERLREAARKAKLVAKASYHMDDDVGPFAVLGIAPQRKLGFVKGVEATGPQMATLGKFGVKVSSPISKGRASQLLDELFRRLRTGEASFKQTRLLQHNGYDTDGMTIRVASAAIKKLFKEKGWGR